MRLQSLEQDGVEFIDLSVDVISFPPLPVSVQLNTEFISRAAWKSLYPVWAVIHVDDRLNPESVWSLVL